MDVQGTALVVTKHLQARERTSQGFGVTFTTVLGEVKV